MTAPILHILLLLLCSPPTHAILSTNKKRRQARPVEQINVNKCFIAPKNVRMFLFVKLLILRNLANSVCRYDAYPLRSSHKTTAKTVSFP